MDVTRMLSIFTVVVKAPGKMWMSRESISAVGLRLE
jgi:hypothetical protein